MKKIGIVIIMIVSLFIGCDETSKTVVSATNDYTTAGDGQIVATIDNSGADLNLKGTLNLNEGEFKIFLSNPLGDTVYSESYKDSGSYNINESFKREIGNWTFSYSIIEVEDVPPSGSYNFDITYSN